MLRLSDQHQRHVLRMRNTCEPPQVSSPSQLHHLCQAFYMPALLKWDPDEVQSTAQKAEESAGFLSLKARVISKRERQHSEALRGIGGTARVRTADMMRPTRTEALTGLLPTTHLCPPLKRQRNGSCSRWTLSITPDSERAAQGLPCLTPELHPPGCCLSSISASPACPKRPPLLCLGVPRETEGTARSGVPSSLSNVNSLNEVFLKEMNVV